MQPPMERQSVVGKQNMALMARFLSVELRKMTPGVAAANVAMIFINQLRVDPKNVWKSRRLSRWSSFKARLFSYGKFSSDGWS